MKSLYSILLIGILTSPQSFGQMQNDTVHQKGIERARLFFSLGLGGTFVSSNVTEQVSYPNEYGLGWKNIGVGTSFKIGHALNTHWTIYYHNLVNWVKESSLENRNSSVTNSIFANGLTGVGATYFVNKTSPSPFFNASLGLASRMNAEVVTEYAEKGYGFGFVVGTGYQFANRWAIEANLMYGNVKGRPKYDNDWASNFWSAQITFNYLWFKSFKEERWDRLGLKKKK